jgi:hypothetical protein
MTATCSEEMACQADGGTWGAGADGCSFPGEGGLGDAAFDGAPGDAAPDVLFAFPCCNANGDPCCQYLQCGAPLTAACSQELACQTDGGTWSLQTLACSLPGDAGPGDAVADGNGRD